MSHIVKATELKLLAKFHDDLSKQSVSNATSPNYADYKETHAWDWFEMKDIWAN